MELKKQSNSRLRWHFAKPPVANGGAKGANYGGLRIRASLRIGTWSGAREASGMGASVQTSACGSFPLTAKWGANAANSKITEDRELRNTSTESRRHLPQVARAPP